MDDQKKQEIKLAVSEFMAEKRGEFSDILVDYYMDVNITGGEIIEGKKLEELQSFLKIYDDMAAGKVM